MDRKSDVLALLKGRTAVGLAEIARHLGVTKQGALRHLEALRARGLVEVTTEERHGPGRPGHAYRLTAAAADQFPSRHRELATELVAFMDEPERERFFAERARRLEAEYAARMRGRSLDERVRELAGLTSEQGHMSEVVQVADGSLQLRHCNCPIQEAAAMGGHPCRHELDLYRRLLGAYVARSTWLGAGDPSCTYHITAERNQVG